MNGTMKQRIGIIAWAAALVGLLIFGIFSTGLASVSPSSLKANNQEKVDDRAGLIEVHRDSSNNNVAALVEVDGV